MALSVILVSMYSGANTVGLLFSCVALVNSIAYLMSSPLVPPITTIPLSKTSGRSVDVLSNSPGKPNIALSFEKVPLSESTHKEFFLSLL